MQALISGQAGVAMLWEGDSVWSVTVDSPEALVSRSRTDVLYLFSGADDAVQLADVTREEAIGQMQQAWRLDRALQMMLILLDHEDDEETRTLAAQCVERHFADSEIEVFVANRLYAAPLPIAADLLGAKLFVRKTGLPRVVRFLEGLELHQPQIAVVRRAFDALDEGLFGSSIERSHCERTAIAAGAFRRLVEAAADGSVDAAVIACLQDPRLTTLSQYRRMLTDWVAPLRATRARSVIAETDIPEPDDPDVEAPEGSSKRVRRSRKDRRSVASRKQPSKHEQFVRAQSELDTIEQLLDEGRILRARQYADQLVERQLVQGDRQEAAKTLCNLARLAKTRSLHDWQLELTGRATLAQPSDLQAHCQWADAHFCVGQLDEALRLYEEICVQFEWYEVARNGRAEALRKLGRLEEALRLYEDACREFPRSEFARNGRASVLVDMGRYAEALGLLPSGELRTRHDWIACHIRGMIHLRRGEFLEATRIFEGGVEHCSHGSQAIYFRTALAVARIQLGQFREAVGELETSQTDVARVLRLHALGELGEMQQTRAEFEHLRTSQRRRVADLRDTLAPVFVFPQADQSVPSPDWRARVFAAECALVQAA